ncbi:MAG TPA: lytic murein transglycosylase, partial [Xanthobacteraceae bacterium]
MAKTLKSIRLATIAVLLGSGSALAQSGRPVPPMPIPGVAQAPAARAQAVQAPSKRAQAQQAPASARPAAMPPAAAPAPQREWSGESGSSGHPLMQADAIRASAGNFQN